MNTTINSMPPWLAAIAYGSLVLGVVFSFGFVADYVGHTEHLDEIGRHMVAMSANVGGFFVLYLALAVWPDFPGRGALRFVGLVVLVANCGWRWYLYRKSRKEAWEGSSDTCPHCGSPVTE